MFDFVSDARLLVGILANMPDKDLVDEYLILQACYKKFDDVSEKLGCCDSLLLPYMDFIESYMMQEISKRYCGKLTAFPVATYGG